MKRSFRRALRRLAVHGYATYRGQSLVCPTRENAGAATAPSTGLRGNLLALDDHALVSSRGTQVGCKLVRGMSLCVGSPCATMPSFCCKVLDDLKAGFVRLMDFGLQDQWELHSCLRKHGLQLAQLEPSLDYLQSFTQWCRDYCHDLAVSASPSVLPLFPSVTRGVVDRCSPEWLSPTSGRLVACMWRRYHTWCRTQVRDLESGFQAWFHAVRHRAIRKRLHQ